MRQITLGKTGITVPQNAFGCLPIQRVSKEAAVKLLRRAYDGGMRFFDTARAYSDSEEKIGYALSDVRDKIIITTKTAAKTAARQLARTGDITDNRAWIVLGMAGCFLVAAGLAMQRWRQRALQGTHRPRHFA